MNTEADRQRGKPLQSQSLAVYIMAQELAFWVFCLAKSCTPG